MNVEAGGVHLSGEATGPAFALAAGEQPRFQAITAQGGAERR